MSPSNALDGNQPSIEKSDDRNKTPRHPRWTRQETLVLVEAKNIAEERGRTGRKSSSVFGPDFNEPKWDFVSSYCKRRGVDRGPVQCRKRWSNLVSDFKKIKNRESLVEMEEQSYWFLRSDLRRERKLPGFFDREVYDVLDGKEITNAAYQLALVTSAGNIDDEGVYPVEVEVEDEDEETETEANFDSGIHVTPEEEFFQDFEEVDGEEIGKSSEKDKISSDGKQKDIPSPVPISEMRYQPFYQTYSNQGSASKRRAGPQFWRSSTSQEGVKRRRQSSNGSHDIDVGYQLINAIERNTNLLKAQFEDQKKDRQVQMEQQKEQHETLITALTKITDALGKIADKLK